MLENIKRDDHERNDHRCSGARRMGRLALRLALGVLGCGWLLIAAGVASAAPGRSGAPVEKIVVFPFALQDHSAAASVGSAPNETKYLTQATDAAKRELLGTPGYRLIAAPPAGGGELDELRRTEGCDRCVAALARKLGADRAVIGEISKVSMVEYVVNIRIIDAHDARIISQYSSDLQMGADYSWSRGVRSLMENRVLVGQTRSP